MLHPSSRLPLASPVKATSTNVGTSALASGGAANVEAFHYLKTVPSTAAFQQEIAAPMMGLTVLMVHGMQSAPVDKLSRKRSPAMNHAFLKIDIIVDVNVSTNLNPAMEDAIQTDTSAGTCVFINPGPANAVTSH